MIETGSIAVLKSGGPKMTVVKYTVPVPSPQGGVPPVVESVECWWFDENTLYKAEFPPGALDVTEDKEAKHKTAPAPHKAGDK